MSQICKPLFLITIVSAIFSKDPEFLYNQGLNMLEKTEINNGISEIKSWLNENRTTEEYEEKLSELQQRLEPLVSRLFPSSKPSEPGDFSNGVAPTIDEID